MTQTNVKYEMLGAVEVRSDGAGATGNASSMNLDPPRILMNDEFEQLGWIYA
jgi:hypothetical protein